MMTAPRSQRARKRKHHPTIELRIQKKDPRKPRAFLYDYYFADRYWSIAFAATLPAPIAEMTVAAPVTASPPA